MTTEPWIPFNPDGPLPAERRYVLLSFAASRSRAQFVAMGYLRYAAGDLHSPYFVTPGLGGIPTHWCDCLGDDYRPPNFESSAREHGHPAMSAEQLAIARAAYDAAQEA